MKYKNTIISVFLVLLIGCQKELGLQQKSYPYFITKEATDINANGVTLNAELIDKGQEQIVDFGFLWEDGETEYKYSLLEKGGSLNNFTLRISSDLDTGGIYSYKAYAETIEYQIFGNTVSFESLGSIPPEIVDFNPKIGFDTSEVVLTGKYFSHNAEKNSVFVNNMEAEILYSGSDSIIFKTPKMAYFGDAEISVAVGSQKTIANKTFQILGPQIESISSTSGHSGEYLTITGQNFIQNGETLNVYFDGISATIIDTSETALRVVVPPPFYTYLLEDHAAIIEVFNGPKSVEFTEPYIIIKSWEEKQATPFDWSWNSEALTYNNKGYILEMNAKELYEYSPVQNQWNIVSDFPGGRTDGSLYLVHNDKFIKLGGIPPGGENDLWEYDFTNNDWTQKDDIPFSFHHATHFKLADDFYIITTESHVWKYSPEIDLFIRLNDFPADLYIFIHSFINNGIAYAVSTETTWKYEPNTDTWDEFCSNSFSYSNSLGFSTTETGYMLDNGKDLFKLDMARKQWILTSKYPANYGSNSYKTAFLIEEKTYVAVLHSNYSGGAPLMFVYQDLLFK